jgi:hypothetical protein
LDIPVRRLTPPGSLLRAGISGKSGAKGSGGGENGVEAEVGPMEEGGEFRKAEGEAFGGGGAEGDVAEFAAGAGGLSVEVEVGVGDGEDFCGFGEFPDEIEHGGMAGETR